MPVMKKPVRKPKKSEKIMWENFCTCLDDKFRHSNKLVYILGFVKVRGVEVDCILIHPNCVCVIDFKSYTGPIELRTDSGERLKNFTDNSVWHAVGSREIVKGGAQLNPFDKIEKNRWRLYEHIKSINNETPLLDLRNFANISGMVLFGKKGNFPYYTPSDRPDGAHKWFYVTDMDHVVDCIENIGKRGTVQLSDSQITAIVEKIRYNREDPWRDCSPNDFSNRSRSGYVGESQRGRATRFNCTPYDVYRGSKDSRKRSTDYNRVLSRSDDNISTVRHRLGRSPNIVRRLVNVGFYAILSLPLVYIGIGLALWARFIAGFFSVLFGDKNVVGDFRKYAGDSWLFGIADTWFAGGEFNPWSLAWFVSWLATVATLPIFLFVFFATIGIMLVVAVVLLVVWAVWKMVVYFIENPY